MGRGYVIGIIVFGLFAFLLARTQAPEWGTGAAIGAAVFVAFFAAPSRATFAFLVAFAGALTAALFLDAALVAFTGVSVVPMV